MKKNLRFIFSFLLMLVCSIVGRAATGDVYKLVTNDSELKDGDVVVIASVNKAMKSINSSLSGQCVDAVGVTIQNGALSWFDGLGEVTLEKTTGGWYLKMDGQYINTRNNGKSYLLYNKRMAFSTARDSKNGLYSITVASSGSATIENLGRDNNEYISYTADGFMFGDGSKIQILKKHELVKYTFDESKENTIEAWDNANVTLNRTLAADKWNTLCLPFDVEGDNLVKLLGEGAQVTEYSTTDSEGTLKFAKADKIVAGKPYLVKPTVGGSQYTFEGIEIKVTEPTVAGDDVKFKGLFSPKDITEGGSVTAAGVTASASVVFANPGSTTKAFRAYFVVPQTSSASALRLSIDNTPTAISDIYVDGEAADAPVYNLQGQRVDGRSLAKGVYIKNGRKFVVK